MFWERLARHHPRFSAEAILEKLANSEDPDGLLLRYARSVAMLAGRAAPDHVVKLVRALAVVTPLSTLQVRMAAYHRPTELTQVVLETNQSTMFSLIPIARKIDTQLLLRILCEQPAALPVQANWFRKLPPLERGRIFDVVGRSWRDAEGFVPADLLALLPAKQRLDEAKRISTLPQLSTRPTVQATYSTYLPWTDMKAIIDRFLTHPEGEMRASGWGTLIASLRYERNQAGNVLAMIRQRKFEQDPVRLVILQGLTLLPRSVWDPSHLTELTGLIREALDAADLSYGSATYLTGFVQKLIPRFPEWAAQQLALIYSERGNIGGYHLESRINDKQTLVLESAFIDVGVRWGKGNRVGWLVWFASALGRRLRVCQRLLKTLESLLGDSGHYDSLILQLLRQHSSAGDFENLAKRLVAGHESWVAVAPVFAFLHEHRQDLLEPSLSKEKFKMKGGAFVELVSLLPANGYRRYTLTQQLTLAKTLNAIIKLPTGDAVPRDVWTMLRAMNILALLPAVEPSRLIDLSNDARAVIAEAAIRALGRLDAGQGLPTLFKALDDSRARVAIYSLRQAMADMPANRVLADLRSAPMNKVTVAKEIIRLIGEFAGPAGFDWLIALAKQTLHRDVRIAVLRGLWDHLERPESWELLSQAASEGNGQLLNGVVRIPADQLSASSRQRLIDLLIGLMQHDDAIIRLAVLRRFIEMPFPDEEGRMVQMSLHALSASSPDEREAAARLITVNARSRDAERIAREVSAIRERRRPLRDFVQTLINYCLENSPGRRRLSLVARAIVEGLRDDPLTGGLRINLAAVVFGIEGFENELSNLKANQLLHTVAINEASMAIERIAQTPDRSSLERLEHNLASSSDPEMRLLAFISLIAQARDHNRWNDRRRERLFAYRKDSAPAVATRAQFFFDADADDVN